MFAWLRRLFTRDDTALTLIQDGRRRDISVRELALGNKLAGDALLAVLAEKGLVNPAEVREKIHRLTEASPQPGGLTIPARDVGADEPPVQK
jgi:hypothetical protein